MKKNSLLKSLLVAIVAISLGGCVTCLECSSCYFCVPAAQNEQIDENQQVQTTEKEEEILAKKPTH